MRHILTIACPPLLCLGLLGGVVAGNWQRATPEAAALFHDRARAAVESIPYVIGDWMAIDQQMPAAAVSLLRPNAILSRRYVDHGTGTVNEPWADLLVVQCSDPRDMIGHYPPVCYPAAGESMVASRLFHTRIGATPVSAREYQFIRPEMGPGNRRCVYDFFVVPDHGVVPDIGGVRDAGADAEQQRFGAAQIQVVMAGELPQATRDRIFSELLGGQERVLRALDWTGRQ